MTTIRQAVEPLRSAAIERAEKDTLNMVGAYLARIAEHYGDVNAAFPFPNFRYDDKAKYRAKKARHDLARRITRPDPDKPMSYRMGEPYFVVTKPEAIDKLVDEAKQMASQQYDLFIMKLVDKVGSYESASLEGNHVWGHSILTVTKADGSVERWKTQQIVNQSVLGTIFNQWPTRKVK